MLELIGAESLGELVDQTVPANIRLGGGPLKLPEALTESEAIAALQAVAAKNKVFKSFIGMGYYGTITPPVILRNILENPGWYTQYTPYQAEISQGRLEALLNFQTMVSDLTALPIANASMLDEATAAAETMHMCHSQNPQRKAFFVSNNCHPQTIAVVKSRAKWLGIEVVVGELGSDPALRGGGGGGGGTPHRHAGLWERFCGVLVQYPGTDGRIEDFGPLTEAAHAAGTMVVAATDLLALTFIKPPGEWAGGGADIAIGSAQRFGVPMGFGGPHAAFMACKTEFTRKLPGRIVGVSKDAHGNPAYRLALQTREQHIRREKATSNICTAQVLLAIMASMYAVYHGPDGLKAIAQRIHGLAKSLHESVGRIRGGLIRDNEPFFDTLVFDAIGGNCRLLFDIAAKRGINLRLMATDYSRFAITVDETTTKADLIAILQCMVDAYPELHEAGDIVLELPDFSDDGRIVEEQASWEKWTLTVKQCPQLADKLRFIPCQILKEREAKFPRRTSPFLTHPVFNRYHAEHEMLRYIKRLEAKDLSLTTSMIPLGSCTMKLNATSEMIPVTWPEFANLHPFAPVDQAAGYAELFEALELWLAEITGFAAVSLQPNAGSQGEYAGLLAIREYHEARGEMNRNICLIPTSAHGTNPASATVAGLKVVAVGCDSRGNIDVEDLRKKAAEHAANLACIMITYPSTHGVFEESVKKICEIVHVHGGQVYMDGANMNAQVGLTSPGTIGADVCHLNLHKTFSIPHGGGGPGVGPIAVAQHLVSHLPKKPEARSQKPEVGKLKLEAPIVVSAAPYGSASILPIAWMYIRMMGEAGLTLATQVAILNANYMAKRLETHYPVLYRGKNGRCAHEFILDCREFETTASIKVEDIAKRLMDYGFHAPTMSWPVPGTLMFEPTESESKAELDRLCDAMIAIRGEIRAIEEGRMDRVDNPLKNAPHTAAAVTSDTWNHKYAREMAAYPTAWTREGGGAKFWPSVGRIDNPYGDRNLICACPPTKA